MKILFWILFKLTCWILFLYQAFRCLDKFFQQKTATKNSYVNQEQYPRYIYCLTMKMYRIDFDLSRPLICLGSVQFTHLNKSMQALIPNKNYTRGQWRSERLDMDEEELFEHLTLELSELLDYIRINKEKEKGEATERKSFKCPLPSKDILDKAPTMPWK